MDGSHRRARWSRRTVLPAAASLALSLPSLPAALVGQYSPSSPSVQSPAARSAGRAEALVLQNVTVVDVTSGRLLADQTVVVAGNRIQGIGKAGKGRAPEGAQVVDAKGKYLIPGLWDLSATVNDRFGEWYPRFVAHGVTAVRTAPPQADSARAWRQDVAAGTRVGPRLFGPDAELMGAGIKLSAPADARRVIDSLKAAGIVSVTYRDTYGDRDPFLAIAQEARRAGLPLIGTAPSSLKDAEAADAGLLVVDRVQDNHRCWSAWPAAPDSTAKEQPCAPAASAYNRNKTWLMPELARVHWTEKTFGPAQRFVGMMRRLGVKQFLAGSGWDAGLARKETRFRPGTSAVEEVVFLGGAGLTPLEALQAATLNPAKLFKATDSLGTVAKGKVADLVLLDADPIANIRNVTKIDAVVANGRYFGRAALDSLDPDGVKLAQEYADDIVTYGRLRKPGKLGIQGTAQQGGHGVRIQSVAANSAAKAAGLKAGDVIVGVDGKAIDGIPQLRNEANTWKAGQQVTVEVTRNGEHQKVTITLGE